MIGQYLPALALFVGAPLVIWWMRRRRPAGGQAMRVVSRTALTRSSVVAVVETGGRRFLIGATDSGVSLLGEIDGETVADAETTEEEDMDASAPVVPIGPRTGPLDSLRAMTVRVPTRQRPARVLRP